MNTKKVGLLLAVILLLSCVNAAAAQQPKIKLGNEVLMSKYHHLIEEKKVGLVTNQSGVTGSGRSFIDVLAEDRSTSLAALFGPEHGIDGKASAGAYVESYTHPTLGIPVYSLYGKTRMPTREMLQGIDVLLFDIQDIGARTYTYMSTLNYCLKAAAEYNKTVVVLDRPNPLGGTVVEGPVLEDRFVSFVGVDNLPMAHGMTAGELAKFFNRKIGARLEVIPMEGYSRTMVYQDTGLEWIPTSPNIPDLDSVFGYMATGLGEGTGVFQADKFKWIGGNGINARTFADLMNGAGLKGVSFIPETRGSAGGVRLNITDYKKFNPARAGIYALAYAHSLSNFKVPKSTSGSIVMFDKIMGTDKIGQYLEQGLSPQQIEARYAPALEKFKQARKKYLLPQYGPSGTGDSISVMVNGQSIFFDSPPFIDANDRVMVPLRAVAEGLEAVVDYDPAGKRVTVNKNGSVVLFTINSSSVIVDGTTASMDTVPVIKNSRTMLPLRYVGEFLGAAVNWDQSSRTVTVDLQ